MGNDIVRFMLIDTVFLNHFQRKMKKSISVSEPFVLDIRHAKNYQVSKVRT